MSFRLFIYYCALCGSGGAFLGWALGRGLAPDSDVLGQGVKGLFLGLTVAGALGLLDSLWVYSLRRMDLILARAGTAVLVGSVGGLFGGLVGQILYGKVAELAVFYVLGWTLTGLLIGVSLGVFDLTISLLRNQDPALALGKILKGILGGSVGGVLGGILSLLLHSLVGKHLLHASEEETRLWSPSAYGFMALGACIGLFIGLAQVILKEGWLRVEAGFRKGREVILGKPEITLGRAEGCDIGLFGDAAADKLHARIRLVRNRYILTDAGSSAGTFVNDECITGPYTLQSGDVIRVGNSVLRFGERQKHVETTASPAASAAGGRG
jgi:hypothetical protein